MIHHNTTHGHASRLEGLSPTYVSWHAMIGRCCSPTHKDYPRYGGAGIDVCDEWQDFEKFLAEMGERPEGTTLGRKDNKKGYFKDNCSWQTPSQQSLNRGPMSSNTSGFRGVAWHVRDQRWTAQIKRNRNTKHLGNFLTKEEAIQARLDAEEEYASSR